MYACVCVYMYAYMYVCMYACMHVCVYVCVHIRVYAYMYVCTIMYYVCMHSCMYVCMYICMYACIYICMHACVCACTGHGNIKSYLHRFRIIEARDCPRGNGNQTAGHILLECGILQEERERLMAAVAKTDSWPIKKDTLIKKHNKAFAEFTEKIDKTKELNTP